MARRLAAILAMDVVAYSRLMEQDEAGTLAALKVHRSEFIDPLIAEHGGRIVKLMGDGTLVEFSSVVDAVACAVAVQRGMAGRNAEVPERRRIAFRIGVNLGDVISDGDDIYGDGVNIAARLEALAEPGGLCVSGTVQEHVDGKLAVTFTDDGEQTLKNLSRPVRVWRWAEEGRGAAPQPPAASGAPPSRDKPSIAVLPFTNISGDPEQEYFADGITEDLIITLGRCRWILVIARNSTFAYKGQSPDVRAVSRELGVRYVLEGSVRRSGNRVRVTTQLTDGKEGTNVFGERYDRQLSDVFELQEEIATLIAGAIEPELSEIEGAALRNRPTNDLSAWDSYQKGLWYLYRFNTDQLDVAKSLFERAIELDGSFSQAFARLAYVHIQLAWYGPRDDRSQNVAKALQLASRAVELDGKDPSARLSLGRAHTLSGDFAEGIEQLRIATSLDPSFAQAHFALGQALTSLDLHDEAVREMNVSITLSPRDPHLWTFYHVRAIAHYIAGNLEAGEADAYMALRQPNVTFYPYTVLVPILVRLGKEAEAAEALRKLRKLKPGFSLADAVAEWHFGDRSIMTTRFMARFEEDFRRGELCSRDG